MIENNFPFLSQNKNFPEQNSLGNTDSKKPTELPPKDTFNNNLSGITLPTLFVSMQEQPAVESPISKISVNDEISSEPKHSNKDEVIKSSKDLQEKGKSLFQKISNGNYGLSNSFLTASLSFTELNKMMDNPSSTDFSSLNKQFKKTEAAYLKLEQEVNGKPNFPAEKRTELPFQKDSKPISTPPINIDKQEKQATRTRLEELIQYSNGNIQDSSNLRFLNLVDNYYETLNKNNNDPLTTAIEVFANDYFPDFLGQNRGDLEKDARRFYESIQVGDNGLGNKEGIGKQERDSYSLDVIKSLISIDLANTFHKQEIAISYAENRKKEGKPVVFDLKINDPGWGGLAYYHTDNIELNFKDLIFGITHPSDGYSTVVHEYTHIVDGSNEHNRDSILPGMGRNTSSQLKEDFYALSDYYNTNSSEPNKRNFLTQGYAAAEYMMKNHSHDAEYITSSVELFKETDGNFFFSPNRFLPTHVQNALKRIGYSVSEWLEGRILA